MDILFVLWGWRGVWPGSFEHGVDHTGDAVVDEV